MKIKISDKSYRDVLALPKQKHRYPKRPNILFRTLLKLVSIPDLCATHFSCEYIGMEKLGKKEPCLFLMNHSSFIDLKIAVSELYPRPLNIVCTSDGFVGKRWLLHQLGCISTNKFITDVRLVKDMLHTVRKLKSSILMFPEASYSFDGTATPLPESLGKCIKALNVPVVFIRTYGAFARDPLYNGLQRRKTKVSASMEYLLSPAEIQVKTTEEINAMIANRFSFDNFRWQQDNGIQITESFRADGLNRVLYKCPHCHSEKDMVGKGVTIHCTNCQKGYTLTELGALEPIHHKGAFTHIPDWYRWQRESVRQELLDGDYKLEVPVDICMMVNTKRIYRIGEGTLTHTAEGFRLVGCDGQLDYQQKPSASYSLYADYFWYEVGDVICIGNDKALYYCFPKGQQDVVAKTRLATEELFKLYVKRPSTV